MEVTFSFSPGNQGDSTIITPTPSSATMVPLLCPICNPHSRESDGDFPLNGKDLDSVTDETLSTLLESAPVLHDLGDTKLYDSRSIW
ncbi:hypothetical protein N7517_005661 [Penicillium concentricum]|uniref:Uncharacterized protein n=1 Tax=Penicillium concentricum TaxID=293559 RepID=A0A9W9S882_9EURO|nr:uncharacterized protein N7517_005661 [Penicillium concentricum]KAJ5373655.1 hypothetical protein N7517_005661 [Penicillium concentricum]